MRYPRLCSPITIRGHEIPNRVVLAPMGTKFNHHDGSISDPLRQFPPGSGPGRCRPAVD